MPVGDRLPEQVKAKILDFPEHRMGAHRVALRLADGRLVEDVTVAWGDEVIRVGGDEDLDFRLQDVVDAENRI
jgi:hypothetical protein